MLRQLRPAIVALLLLTLITGVLYPLAITGIAATLFPHQSGGSVMQDQDGKAVGSELIGQFFDDPHYFWPRPSATSPVPYVAFNADKGTSSSGSNLGPSNPALIQAVKDRIAALKKVDPDNALPIPVDLVTASASGLDPHISLAAAEYQVPRVARLRGMPEYDVRRLVVQCTESRQLGVLGEPRVNVLKLNLALAAAPSPATASSPATRAESQ
jgi:potassium-transporting ATPase KdpC subunit